MPCKNCEESVGEKKKVTLCKRGKYIGKVVLTYASGFTKSFTYTFNSLAPDGNCPIPLRSDYVKAYTAAIKRFQAANKNEKSADKVINIVSTCTGQGSDSQCEHCLCGLVCGCSSTSTSSQCQKNLNACCCSENPNSSCGCYYCSYP